MIFIARKMSGSGSFSKMISPRFYDIVCNNGNTAVDPPGKHEQSFASMEPNVVKEGYVKGISSTDPQLKSNNPEKKMKGPSHIDKTSSRYLDKNAARAEGIRHEKRKSAIPSSPGTRRKSSLTKMLSFKRREGYSNSVSLSPKAFTRKPIAGSQIPCSPLQTKLSNTWSSIEPNTFRVRGKKYFRDKKKEFAPNCAAFYPFEDDIFLSPQKNDHIARFVELPAIGSSGIVPPILVVNLQIPLYPPTIFQNEHNGEGMSFVFYFKLSENYSKEIPIQFQENIQGNKAEDLPENMLCCIRLKEIDYTNYH